MFSYENTLAILERPIVSTSLNYLLALLGFSHEENGERNRNRRQ